MMGMKMIFVVQNKSVQNTQKEVPFFFHTIFELVICN